MSTEHAHKTVEFMTKHFTRMHRRMPSMFYGIINELSIMANGGSLEGERRKLYPCSFHTDLFFEHILDRLGYDRDGNKLGE